MNFHCCKVILQWHLVLRNSFYGKNFFQHWRLESAWAKLLAVFFLTWILSHCPQPDTDILMCASDTSLSGHYYATGRSEPARTDPVSQSLFFIDVRLYGLLNVAKHYPLPLISFHHIFLAFGFPKVIRPPSLLLFDSKAHHHYPFSLTTSTCKISIFMF